MGKLTGASWDFLPLMALEEIQRGERVHLWGFDYSAFWPKLCRSSSVGCRMCHMHLLWVHALQTCGIGCWLIRTYKGGLRGGHRFQPTIVTVSRRVFFVSTGDGNGGREGVTSFWAPQNRSQWLNVENICKGTPTAHGRAAPLWPRGWENTTSPLFFCPFQWMVEWRAAASGHSGPKSPWIHSHTNASWTGKYICLTN